MTTPAFEALQNVLQEDFRNSVVQEAIECQDQASPDARALLEESIQKKVKIDGFRNPKKAPLPHLLRSIRDASHSSFSVMLPILNIWYQVHKDLYDLAIQFLASRIPARAESAEQEEILTDSWTSTDISKATEEFQSQHEDLDKDELALMLVWCINFGAPESVSADEQEGTGTVLKWHQWLEELEALPANSPEWEERAVNDFFEAVNLLKEQKRLGGLSSELEALKQQATDGLIFFEMLNKVSRWNAEACSISDFAEVATLVSEFREAILNYQKLNEQSVASSYSETVRLRDAKLDLENKIHQLHEHLHPILSSLTPESPPPDRPFSKVAEEKSEKGDSPEGSEPSPSSPDVTGVDENEIKAKKNGVAESHKENFDQLGSDRYSGMEEANSELAEELGPSKSDDEISPSVNSFQEAELILQDEDLDKEQYSLFWELIAADDLPGAYWLSRSVTACGRVPAVPDYLLAAALGSRWLRPGRETFVDDLRNIAAQEDQIPSGHVQALIRLAAALRTALIAPRTGMQSWLQVPDCCAEIRGLVNAVEGFAHNKIALQPEDLLGAAGAAQREIALNQVTSDVKQWLKEAPKQRLNLKRASAVWQNLVGPQGMLREMLLSVSQFRQQDLGKVQQQLDHWKQKNYISQQIRQIDHELAGRRPRPIEGPILQKMERDIGQACDLASRWCELGKSEDQGDWRTEQVKKLCIAIRETQPDVCVALERLSETTGSPSLSAAALCLKRAVEDLNTFLDSSLEWDSAATAKATWEWFTYEADTLYVALSRRLLWLPELELGDDGLPRDEVTVAQVLQDAIEEKRTLRSAFKKWLIKQDYRFIERLLSAMHDDEELDVLSRQYQEALDGSQEALDRRKGKTKEFVEQAVVDGIVGEERTEFIAVIESMDSKAIQNFPIYYDLLQKVQSDLGLSRDKHLASLTNRWDELKERLGKSRIESSKQERIVGFISSELLDKDTRIVEERLARLAEILDDDRELEETWFRKQSRPAFEEFVDCTQRIEEWYIQSFNLQGIARDLRENSTGSERFLNISEFQRKEYIDANSAWLRLRQQPPQKPENLHPLVVLLKYIGFEFRCAQEDAIRIEGNGKDWLLLGTNDMFTSQPVNPIPQFGSQAAGKYSVLCIWERPGADSFTSRVREIPLTTSNVLILYLSRLKERQRREITRSCRDKKVVLAALDEDLLIFLATREREARLSCFLQCALPLTMLNPYTPFQAGDVPPEMFFGREGMVKELLDSSGSCLVFGGRQLGKSALLRHVMRQFHNPEKHRHAWVEGMNLIFDPNAGRDSIYVWKALREMLKRGQLLGPKVTTESPELIRRYLLDVMEENPQLRVLVMFDEADDFLDADARDGFPVVSALRELMLNTQRRFKVIFTGLHNVQRFQGISNQPLAHFGRPLCVGPLEPRAAQDLVREPMESLGFRFGDNAAVLRILSYTNYHPGLIQLFCRDLLSNLNRRRGNSLPPHIIERDDVESVYRDSNVREDIRKRFNWTLNLDRRYQAIAWSMIVESDQTDSFSSVFSTGQILSLVRDWWPQGFGDEDAFNNLQSLLEELCGLGVLYRDLMGFYRLRSPNLVRLMGTAGDIGDRLLELNGKEPPSPFEADKHHAPFVNTCHYSPLSYEQERILASPQTQAGVGLVFSSEALGMSRLRSAFKRFVPEDSDEGTYTDIPTYVNSGDRLEEWLDENLKTHGRNERNVVCLTPSARARENLEDLVDVALRFCTRHRPRTGQQWFRVLFLMDPPSTWIWLSLSSNKREELENRAVGVVLPLRWNVSGIRQRLTQDNMMDFEEVGRSILCQTGGWHLLLDTFFERCASNLDDPRPLALEFGRELEDSGSELTKKFDNSLGLEVHDVVITVLDLICEYDQLEVEYITPETIENPAFLPEECLLAIEYLVQMGCIARNRNVVMAEPTVKKVMSSR